MFDWGLISDNYLEPANVSLSANTLALLLSELGSFRFRTDWWVDGEEPTDEQWDDIDAAIALAFQELNTETNVYRLQADIELTSDEATYTIDDLSDVPGRDMIVAFDLAHTIGVGGDLLVRVNGVSAAVYKYSRQYFKTEAYFGYGTAGQMSFYRAVEVTATPQLDYGHFELTFSNYKSTDRHKNVVFRGRSTGYQMGRYWIQELPAIDSITFWLGGADLKAGSKIAVYTRG